MTELSDLLRWCIDHPAQRKRIGDQARKVMFTHYTREIIAQDAKTRIDEIKKEIKKRGWNHYVLSNNQKLTVRQSEIHKDRELRKIEQTRANGEMLENKLKNILSTFDIVNQRLEKVSDMMAIYQSMMEKSSELQEKRDTTENEQKPNSETVITMFETKT